MTFDLHAFLHDGTALYDLNDLIAPTDPLFGLVTFATARGINNSGQIIANSVSPTHAYLLTPVSEISVPEPATLAVLGLGAMTLVGLRRRVTVGARPTA